MLVFGYVAVFFVLCVMIMFGISILAHLWPVVLAVLVIVGLIKRRTRK